MSSHEILEAAFDYRFYLAGGSFITVAGIYGGAILAAKKWIRKGLVTNSDIYHDEDGLKVKIENDFKSQLQDLKEYYEKELQELKEALEKTIELNKKDYEAKDKKANKWLDDVNKELRAQGKIVYRLDGKSE